MDPPAGRERDRDDAGASHRPLALVFPTARVPRNGRVAARPVVRLGATRSGRGRGWRLRFRCRYAGRPLLSCDRRAHALVLCATCVPRNGRFAARLFVFFCRSTAGRSSLVCRWSMPRRHAHCGRSGQHPRPGGGKLISDLPERGVHIALRPEEDGCRHRGRGCACCSRAPTLKIFHSSAHGSRRRG